MKIHPECVQEIAAAIGRSPSRAEIEGIETGLLSSMRRAARNDPEWTSRTGEQKLQAAADLAAREALQEADKIAQRRASTLLVQAREVDRLQRRAAQLQGQGRKNPHHAALFERLRQIDDYDAGIRNEVLSDLIPALEANQPGFLGLMDDPANVRAFASAVMDGDTSNPVMARAAKVYIETLDRVRIRANEAGANIGELDYGYLPQPHDTGRIARAGREKFVDDVLPLLRRDRYVDAAGAPMADDELRRLVGSAWDTLATDGLNKVQPGQRGGGSRASRFDDAHRVLHFADADAYLAYNGEYGRGSSWNAIHGHVGGMAKTIGMMEEFGPNPNATFRLLKDSAEVADGRRGGTESFATLDNVWDTLNGTTSQPVNERLARFFQGVRNFTTAVKLQSVMLSSITDVPLQVIVAKSAGIPVFKEGIPSLLGGAGKQRKALAHDLALGMDEVAGEMARWHQDHLAQGWTSKLANATMRLTLVEGWTNGLRRGMALALSRTLDRMRATDWSELSTWDLRRMEASGVTEGDWKIWQMAESQDGRLTRHAIRDIPAERLDSVLEPADRTPDGRERAVNRAVARLLGHLDQEARTAVLAPDLQTRAMVQQGTRSGTVGGELLRSVMLFKSFAFGIVDKHLRRIRMIPTAQGKAAYSAAMLTSLTLFGAISTQLKDLRDGKDPRDMTDPKFWIAAFMQGGGLGIFGDVLYTGMGGEARGGQPNWTSLAGPVFGNAFDGVNVVRRGMGWAIADEGEAEEARDRFGADALRFVKGNTPFVNLWYLRAAFDRMVMHDMQEQLSPGYLHRIEDRAYREHQQEFWWRPGEATPDRAPRIEAAAGTN